MGNSSNRLARDSSQPDIIANTATGVSYERKPYITGDNDDYIDQMTRVPRKAIEDQQERPRSNFDKPYISDNYPEMEQFQPPPIIPIPKPHFPQPPFNTPVPNAMDDWPESGGICKVILDGPFYCCCESGKNNVTEHERDYCYADAGMMQIPIDLTPKGGSSGDIVKTWLTSAIVTQNGARCITEYYEGGPTPLKIKPATDNFADGDVLELWIYGANRKLSCHQKIEITCFQDKCCDCINPPEGAFTFDTTNTPETIIAGSSIDVYVTGGCPPFTWSVTGTGYSFESGTTKQRVNTLVCATGT